MKRLGDREREEGVGGSEVMPPCLQQYLSGRVTVHYNAATSGYQDSGTLTFMDENWVELTKDNKERLLIPLVSIRIIKLLEPSQPEGDATILLRPYEGPPDEKKRIEK